jgi:hypothetical protein
MKLQEVTLQELQMLEVALQTYTSKELEVFHKRSRSRSRLFRLIKFLPFTDPIKRMLGKEELEDMSSVTTKLNVVTQFYMKVHAAEGYDDDMRPATYAKMKGLIIVE